MQGLGGGGNLADLGGNGVVLNGAVTRLVVGGGINFLVSEWDRTGSEKLLCIIYSNSPRVL